MSAGERVIRSRRVVLPDAIRPAAIGIVGGRVSRIGNFDDFHPADITDFGESVVMPGLVDTHVHINEPGRTEWEGFETATMAAAAGGVTTLVEMPLNSIPATTTRQALNEKVAAAENKLFVDVGFWGGVVPGNTQELAAMHAAGAFGFKCFLVPSGVAEFEGVVESDLREAIPELVRLGTVLLVHAELQKEIDKATLGIRGRDPRCYATWLQSHPADAENHAIDLVIRLAEEFRAKVHVVHLSSAESMPAIRAAKQRGVNLSIETCPHYLNIAAEEIPDGACEFKCAPPIRNRANQEKLWAGLREGIIDFIVTDHSPAPPGMKRIDTGDYMRAWGGIASLQLNLPLTWTAAHKRGFEVSDVANWVCHRPAKFAGLSRKGEIGVGADADFVVWNPEEPFQVERERLFFRHKLTPYLGRQLFGVVDTTFLRGEEVYSKGRFPAGCRGRVLRRGGS